MVDQTRRAFLTLLSGVASAPSHLLGFGRRQPLVIQGQSIRAHRSFSTECCSTGQPW
jgi:hypothetical protein